MKMLEFNISCFGLCSYCDSKTLFDIEVPDDWDDMSEDEQHEYAVEIFKENLQWGWCEVES